MKTKKKIILHILALLFMPILIQAQNSVSKSDSISKGNIIGSRVSMEINPEFFPTTKDGAFFSDSPRAMLMPMVMRANFDSLDETKLLSETEKELGIKVTDKGHFKKKGRKVYYVTGTTQDKERNIVLEVFYIKGDDTRTIMVTVFYEKLFEKLYDKEVRNAVLSARLEDK